MARVNVAIQITSNYRGAPGFKKAEKDVSRFRRQVGRAANSVRAFQFVLAGVTISTLTIWGKKIIDVASQLQLLQIRLANVEGGAAAGNRKFRELFDTFKTAPFELDKIIDGFVRLRAAGVGSEVATETMKSLVDAVAVFGGTSAELQRATIGFQQVAGKGVLSMEELRQQIGEAVPSAMALMSRAAGISVAEFVERVKKGMISAQEAIALFNSEAKKQFGGFAQTLRFTISGSLQGLKSQINIGIGDLFNVRTDLSARVAATIQVITDRVTAFISAIDQNTVDHFWGTFTGVAAIIEGVAKAISLLVIAIAELFGFVGNVLGPSAGSGFAAGLIGTMLFGRKIGILIGALTTAADKMGLIDAAMKGIAEHSKQGFAEGGMLGRFLDATGGREPVRGVDLGIFGSYGTPIGSKKQTDIAGSQGDIFDVEPLSAFQKALAETKKGLENIQFAKLRPGILGLGSAAEKLSNDLLTLSQRASIAAENTETPWLKTTDKMSVKLSSLRSQIKTLGPQLVKDADALRKEIEKQPSSPAKDASLKFLNEEFVRAQQSLGKMNEFANQADAAIQKLRETGAKSLFDKMTKELVGLEAASAKALGTKSELQLGLEALEAKSNLNFVSMTKLRDVAQSLVDRGYQEFAEIVGELTLLIDNNSRALSRNQDAVRRQTAASIEVAKAELNVFREKARQRIEASQQEMQTGLQILMNDELGNQVRQIKNQLTEELLNNILNIKRINEQIAELDEITDAAKIARLREQIALYQEINGQIGKQREETTKTGELNKQTWKNVGDIIKNSVGNAIEGVITGTMTFKEAGLQMWRALIREAAKYIAKLIMINALKAAKGIGLFNLFADGGAFKGNVKPFADGGIVRGPTMFGLAGEAGTEAIMPLKRVNGKLGVATDGGGGGDNFTVNIQAVDTQTGTQFLIDNMQTIVQGMQHESSLNRGMRRRA